MIFVTLGTQKFQLNRLLRQLDKISLSLKNEEKIFAQIGYSDYRPKNYEYIDFLNGNEFKQKIQQSSLVISHSGVGSIISSIKAGKPVIVFPRLSKFNEHVDDHQLEIAKAFSKKNYVLYCGENDNLKLLINEAKNHNFDKYISSTDKILNIINKSLEDLYK